MPVINLNLLDTGIEDSTSATKAVLASAKVMFGPKGDAIVTRMEQMVKIKELDTSRIDYVLDMIKTKNDDELRKWKATAQGKSIITSARALVTAKSLVQVINILRQIKVPKTVTQTGVKGTAGVVAKTRTPTKPVVAQRTDTQKALPKVNFAAVTPKFVGKASQAQMDSLAAQLSDATSLTFAATIVQTNGQSAPWQLLALNPNGRYISVSIDPPFTFHEYAGSNEWQVSAQTKGGSFAFGSPLRKPTVQALAKEIKSVLGKAANTKVKAVDMPKTYKITELRRMTHAQRVAFTKKLTTVLGVDSLVYGIDNSGESFKSQPGEEWEMEGHFGANSLHISFDDPYNGTDKGKWIVTPGDGSDSKTFTANDFDGMRAFIHDKKRK